LIWSPSHLTISSNHHEKKGEERDEMVDDERDEMVDYEMIDHHLFYLLLFSLYLDLKNL